MAKKVSVAPPPPPPLLPEWWAKFLPIAVLVVLTLVVYIPAMGGGFLWDDDWLLTDNPNISSVAGLVRFWKIDWWGDKLVPDYFPVTWTSFWIEWHLWHKFAPGYHVTNILLHALSAVLLWRVLRRLGVRWGWLAAALFAVHPVNVTSVAWIAERKNTLSMVFYLLALGCYLRFDDRAGQRWYLAALGMFLLALLSKTSVVMLPVVLLILAWWRRNKVTWRDLLNSAPFFALALALAIVGVFYQTDVVIDSSPIHTAKEGFFFRLAVAGMAPWFYLLKTVVPYPLAMVYPRWDFDPKALVNYLPGLALIGVLAGMWRLRRWCRGPLAALVYFVVTLFPVLGFFNMYYQVYSFVADHWVYIPMLGVLALIAGGAEFLSRRIVPRVVVQGVAALVLVVLGGLAWQRSTVFADVFRLWQDNIDKYPMHFLPYHNLGRAQDDKGYYDDALKNYQKSLQLNDRFDRVYTNIGTLLAKRGDILEAAHYFDQGVRLYPKSVTARGNLGAMLFKMGRLEEGLYQLQIAEKDDPNSLLVRANMATVLMGLGRIDEAMEQARKAVEIDPCAYEPRMELADCLLRKGERAKAQEQVAAALTIKPDSVEAHALMATLLRALGLSARAAGRSPEAADRIAKAAEHWKRILELQPENVDAMNNLGITLVDRGDLQGALTYFTKALEHQPGNLEIQTNVAFVLARLNRPGEAIELYRKALAARPDWPEVLTSLAALLATYPDPAFRNPPEAVTLAQRACELTKYSRADFVDTLSLAYHAAGQRAEAIETAGRALQLARAAGNTEHAAALEQRLRAWSTETPGSPSPAR
jgi:tetratricopeptide (TPR) repeat protein